MKPDPAKSDLAAAVVMAVVAAADVAAAAVATVVAAVEIVVAAVAAVVAAETGKFLLVSYKKKLSEFH